MKLNKSKVLNTIFSVLLFGGLWGIFEATVGTLLHMTFVTRSIFLASTTILVPIAAFLMGACYKRTGSFRSVYYMGLLAASIKAISCVISGLSFNPVWCMLLEALSFGSALLVIRPKNVISLSGLGTFVLGSTVYLMSNVVLKVVNNPNIDVLANVQKYVFTYNMVATLYTFATGAILYGLIKFAQAKSFNFSKIKKVIYNPAFASSMAAIALVLTIVLK